MKNVILFLLFVFSSINCLSEEIIEENKFAIHPRVGYGLNIYNGDFTHLEGSVDCGIFETGIGHGLNFDLGIEYQVFSKLFINLNLGYNDRSGIFSLNYLIPTRDFNDDVIEYNTKNSLDINLHYFTISPQILYTINKNFISGPLRIMSGFTFGIPTNPTFDQYEEITEPDYVVYTNPDGTSSKYRKILAGDITTINKYSFGINIGIENLLYAGNDNHFSQALVFNYNFNDVTTDVNWKTYSIAFFVGYRFSFLNKSKEIETIKPQIPLKPIISIPEEVKEEEDIIVEKQKIIQKIPKLSKKQELNIENIEFTDLHINQGRALLATPSIVNAVFFDKNSSIIPSSYNQSTNNNIDYFKIDAVEAHKYLLVRITDILNQNPNASIKLIGYSSGKKDERTALKLAKSRAISVKNSFINMGISPERISITNRILPKYNSNQDFELGKEENRRVDINLKNAQFQEYINLVEYSELTGNISIEMQNKFLLPSSIISISTNFHQNNIDIEYSNILNNTINIPFKTEINNSVDIITGKISIISDTLSSLKKTKILTKGLPLTINNFDLSNFKAILRFNYNSSSLNLSNKKLLLQLLKQIPEGTIIEITGSSDALGTEERNEKLIQQRAKNTQMFIQSNSKNKIKTKIGNHAKRFAETTPQGRFLNRCIIIILR